MNEFTLSRVPQSIEAEQAVLGSMLIDSRCIPDIIDKLKPECFYLEKNREIFEIIYSMFTYSQIIDPVTVLDRMKAAGVYDENTSRSYILQLMEITPTAANVGAYVRILQDKAMLRALTDMCSQVMELAQREEGEAAQVLEIAERRIYDIRAGKGVSGLEHISRVLSHYYELLGERSRSEKSIPGLPTGFTDLDEVISGLNNTDLILIASRPGMGKTSFALNIAVNAGKKTDKAIAFFSLEMSKEQLAMRLISSVAFVDSHKLMTGRIGASDWEKIMTAAAAISKINMFVDDNPTVTVADISASCRRISNLGLVVIDYLQLMQSASGKVRPGDNRVQIVSDISRALKIMAKELGVPVICLSQLNRAAESSQDKRPTLANLRDSGSIEQDADIVLMLYREDYYARLKDGSAPDNNTAECIVAKNRHGATGVVKLQWLQQYTTFSGREWVHDEDDF
ncbi:MAG: replicative DNA helicase [Clostridiales bacterium]|nr:replicative DNA helicase [Clostridiales bacterium]